MTRKMPSILLVVATVIVLVTGDCMDDIPKGGASSLTGGYQRIEDPEKDEFVQKIVAASIEFYNKWSNDLYLYKDNDNYVAYSQVVLGTNYCFSFQMISYACKNGGTSEICQKKVKMTCTIEAHRAVADAYPTIDSGSLYCQLIA